MSVYSIFHDPDAAECAALIERLRAERVRNERGRSGLHSIGGWHTPAFRVGRDWLGEAIQHRLDRAGCKSYGLFCWGNILPPGASYGAHDHKNQKQVAVWCLTGSGGALHIAPDIVVPDRAGQLVIFPGDRVHWVPTVDQERITVAANLYNYARH